MKVKSVFLQNNMQNPSKFDLLVKGQGVFIFSNKDNSVPCVLYFYNKDKTDGLQVNFTKNGVIVYKIAEHKHLADKYNKKGLSNISGAYYWFSIDAQNQELYAGIGEARLETVIYQYAFNHDHKQFLESIISIHILEDSYSGDPLRACPVSGDAGWSLRKNPIKPIQILRDPITHKIPLLIKDIDELTMADIAHATYMPKSNLSIISQKLYHCIAGKNFLLNTDEFADFSKAIEYSIATPGKWCHKKLKEKSTEFNKDKPNIKETYLRITLGQNNGESPGIPYVMEIWPVGHFSPVHNHAGSSAVIRVLYGKINVKLFPFLSGETNKVEPFSEVQFSKDDVTWISPTLNQTHQLVNLDNNTETCVTIQCYMYENENSLHYDYFDYVDANGKIQQYEPDSDMDFISFREKIMEEWRNK